MDGEKKCPPYIPDFVKLAESYDAYGIRISKPEELDGAFAYAKEHKNAPTIIECLIDPEADVYPMVPTGNTLGDMILG